MIVDYNGQVIASSPYPGEAVCNGVVDIEALRERRADPYDSPLAELRTDLYGEIYAQEIYGDFTAWWYGKGEARFFPGGLLKAGREENGHKAEG